MSGDSDRLVEKYIIPELLKLNILDKNDKEWYKEKLIQSMTYAKHNISWAENVLPELLKLEILDKNDKNFCKNLFTEIINNAQSNAVWAGIVLPELLKLNILNKDEIKDDYKKLLEQ